MTEVGIRELSRSTSRIAKKVQAGETFIVSNHGRPVMKVSPLDEQWETVIDFTKFRKDGIPARELLERLKRIDG